MNISSLLFDLRKCPIPRPIQDAYAAYKANPKRYWTEVIPRIPVDQSECRKEPLSECSKFDVFSSNYYTNTKQLRDSAGSLVRVDERVFLRNSILVTLRKLNNALRAARLAVFVMSGYRSRRLQSLIIANASKEKDDAFARSQFATPGDYLPHASGAAFDVEYWDIHKGRLLPTKWPDQDDKFTIESAHNLSAADEVIRGNRRIIHHFLTEAIVLDPSELFVAHPREYWHYGRHERLSAFFAGFYGRKHPVLYDEVELGDGAAEFALL